MARKANRTTEELLSVNGVELNTFATNIEAIAGRMSTAGRRTGNVTVGGRHGTMRTTGKKLDEMVLSLPMWVIGGEEDGSVPSTTTARRLYFRNVQSLAHLFQGRDEALDVRWVQPNGEVLQCFGDVLDTIDFASVGANPTAKFGVTIVVPAGMWQDLVAREQQVSVPAAATQVQLSRFAGASGPMEDLVFTLGGPWNGPRLTFDDGSWMQVATSIPAGKKLIIDAGTWTLTTDYAQPDLYELLSYSTLSNHWACVPPTFDANPTILVSGAARTTTTSLTVAGRRKYLVG